MTSLASNYTAPLTNLRRLFWLRTVMAVVIGAASWAAMVFYDIKLNPATIVGAVLLMLALNIFTWWRLGRPNPVTYLEMLTQLLLDMSVLTGLFYATGGYTNPFVWMYLLPLTVAAVSLPWRQTWLVAGLAVGSYTALMFWYQPLPMIPMDMSGMDMSSMAVDYMHMMHMSHKSGFSVHLLGMWAGFVVSAGVIAFFVERIGRNLREYDLLAAEAREKMLESERMLALGALAAGAAHELGTPLATMAVLTSELVREHAQDAELAAQLALLRQQVERCKVIISSIASSAGETRAEDGGRVALDVFLQQTVLRWQDTRPAVVLSWQVSGVAPAPMVVADRTLGQALVNLINNAADASPQRVEVTGGWSRDVLQLQIRDYGAGLSQDAAPKIGTPFFTTKEQSGGLGLGIYLARSIIERLGGSLNLQNHPQGGVSTEIRLPLRYLSVEGVP